MADLAEEISETVNGASAVAGYNLKRRFVLMGRWLKRGGYYAYRYLFHLGFLDGNPGLIYCFLHDLWYPFLIDAKCKELQSNRNR